MGLIIPPGFAEIAMEIVNAGDPDPWYVTWGVDTDAADGDIVGVGLASIGSFDDSWLVQLSNDSRVTGCFVTLGQDGAPIRQFVSNPATGQGTNSTAKLPQNCALLVRKNTGIGGRRSRGRFFLPGIVSEANVDNVGRISGGAMTEYQSAADTQLVLLADPVGAPPSTPMVVLHSSGNSAIIDPTPVVSLSVDSVISTQRRRLR